MSSSSPRSPFLIFAGRCLAVIHIGVCGHADAQQIELDERSEEVRMIDGLRERRLYRLAENYAGRILSDSENSTATKIDVAVADLRTRSQKAMQANAEQSGSLWEEFERVAGDYLNQFADANRVILIQAQQALAQAQRAARMRHEIEADMAPPDARQSAFDQIRRAVRDLEGVDRDIDKRLNGSSPNRTEKPLTSTQLLALRHHMQYQVATLIFDRAMLYDADDQPNRIDALTQVESRLESVLTQTTAEHPIWWFVQCDRLALARHRGRPGDAARIISQLPATTTTWESKCRLQSEMMLLFIAQGKLDEAAALDTLDHLVTTTPELDLTRLQLLVAISGDSNRPASQQSVFQKRGVELAEQIGVVHGGYWARRANLLVVSTAGTSNSVSSLEMLILVANEAHRKEEWTDAIRAYEKAADAAQEQDLPDRAFDLAYRAAVLRQQLGDHHAAADKMEEIANGLPAHHLAASVHLMACWNLASSINGDAARLQRYDAMLQYNVLTWPHSSSADQSRVWLARLRLHQHRWTDAVDLLVAVSPTSSLMPQALAELERVLLTQLQLTQAQLAVTSRRSLEKVWQHLVALIDEDSVGEQWGETQVLAAMLVAHLQLKLHFDTPVDIASRLQAAVTQSDQNKENWRSQAAAWFVISALQQRQALADAESLLQQVASDPSARRPLQQGLQYLMESADSKLAEAASSTMILAFQSAENELSTSRPSEQKVWRTSYAHALQNTRQWDAAIEQLSGLVDQYPEDARIWVKRAQLTTEQALAGDPGNLDEALRQWRQIAQRSRPRTEDWFQAKYYVAKVLHEQGSNREAIELLKYLQAFPPGWTQSNLADEFEQLLLDCQQVVDKDPSR